MTYLHRIRRLLLLSLLALLLGLPDALPAAPWLRDYRQSGAHIQSGFIPDSTRIVLGEGLLITFHITNLGAADFSFDIGGDYRGAGRSNRFKVTAVDEKGLAAPDPVPFGDFGGIVQVKTLGPGESHQERLFLPAYRMIASPGRYTVTLTRALSSEKQPAVTVTTRFTVLVEKYDTVKVGEVIEKLGQRLKTGDEAARAEATRALAHIHDPRTLPHLRLALSTGDKHVAISGLATLRTSGAADALSLALADSDSYVRQQAAKALKEMGDVRSLTAKLERQLESRDAAARVRAAVSLGALAVLESVDALAKGLEDTDKAVRLASASALAETGLDEAIGLLSARMSSADPELRIAAGLGWEAAARSGPDRKPMPPEWLTPILAARPDLNDPRFHEAIRLIRMHSGKAAAPAILQFVSFDDPLPANTRNMYLLLAAAYSEGGPKVGDQYDSNDGDTEARTENNRQVLAKVRKWLSKLNP